MPAQRDYSRYAHVSENELHKYSSIDHFCESRLKSGIVSISFGFAPIDLLLQKRGTENLIIVFHAAVNVEKATAPMFVGTTITENLSSSILYVSEPCLDWGLPIGWYAGDRFRDVQNGLVEIFESIITKLGARNVIFYGLSAGGFASLYYSHQFEGSLSICANPQTNILRYFPRQVTRYIEQCWGKQANVTATTDLVAEYEESFDNFVLYIQNVRDEHHVTNHFEPWVRKNEQSESKRWARLVGDWGHGHQAPPPPLQSAVLEFALSFEGDWPALVSSGEFGAALW